MKFRLRAELTRLVAGEFYLRNLSVTCSGCGKHFVLKDSDSAQYCQQCFDAGAGGEKARLDAEVQPVRRMFWVMFAPFVFAALWVLWALFADKWL